MGETIFKERTNQQISVSGTALQQKKISNSSYKIADNRPVPVVYKQLRMMSNKSLPVAMKKNGVIQRFADSAEAKTWIVEKISIYTQSPERRARMQDLINKYNEHLDLWEKCPNAGWDKDVEDSKKALEECYSGVLALESMERWVQSKINKVSTENNSLEKIAVGMATTNWLYSYADDVQKVRMQLIYGNIHTAVESRVVYIGHLKGILQSMNSVPLNVLSKRKETKEFMSQQNTSVKQLVPPVAYIKTLKNEGATLSQALKDQARTQIESMLKTSKTNPDKKLDVKDDAIAGIVGAFISASMKKGQVEQKINNALTLQHAPVKDIWMRKVLGLTRGSGDAYLKYDTGRVDKYTTHVTCYGNEGLDNPSVHTPAPVLKDSILGNGVTGFHVTIETPISYLRPHSYRGGALVLYWNTNEKHFANDPGPELKKIRDREVNSAETKIDNTIRDKGAGIQVGAVKGALKP